MGKIRLCLFWGILFFVACKGTDDDDLGIGSQGLISDILTEKDFDALLPDSVYDARYKVKIRSRNPFYTYSAFIEAASAFPLFCNEGNVNVRKRELAAFLANTSHETTGGYPSAPMGPYYYGYYWIREVGCYNEKTKMQNCPQYVDTSGVLGKKYPPVPGQQYYGRGPIQLSYNYNYGLCGEDLGLGKSLLENADQVARDSVLSIKTAIWFWMTAQGNKPSCHDVMVGKWIPTPQDSAAGRLPGFGLTINIINGGVECGYKNSMEAEDRVGYYSRYLNYYELDKELDCDCENMQPF
ncbi:hypothetical protein FUAX_15550 [Fulvitalea axinellae]|uniref:Glycoside hydrolase family 19 catalytic domain-containing protein n=1 Tax=Fulvitalea axinellae TaxID=1182444 RepID=A0AAU9CM95_9BACT|nr:hypothetical protein FUAX_15550 [Fulvitalea axinellae]